MSDVYYVEAPNDSFRSTTDGAGGPRRARSSPNDCPGSPLKKRIVPAMKLPHIIYSLAYSSASSLLSSHTRNPDELAEICDLIELEDLRACEGHGVGGIDCFRVAYTCRVKSVEPFSLIQGSRSSRQLFDDLVHTAGTSRSNGGN